MKKLPFVNFTIILDQNYYINIYEVSCKIWITVDVKNTKMAMIRW